MKIKNFKVIHNTDILVVAEFEPEEKTQTGIYLGIKSTISQRPTQGRVLQVGKGVENIKVGDMVVFKDGMGIDLALEEEKWYILLNEERILGVFEEDAN